MICALSLFGEMDLQNVIKRFFDKEDIIFLEENCKTSVQLINQVEAHSREVDVVIFYGRLINMDIKEYVQELRKVTENLRVILILQGNINQFLRNQIAEYRENRIDLVFDDDGFDIMDLIKIAKKGKISNKELKRKRKESGFNGEIEEVPHPFGEKNKHKKDDGENIKEKEPTAIESFAEPQGHFTIGILNAARGAGATWTANNLARYFAMQNFKTCITDMSSTGAVSMMKLKNVDIYTEDFDIEEIKNKYNVTIIDFGTPIEVSPKGENFKLMSQYKPETVQCFIHCDIKLIMGFSDPWNIEKIKFFFINDTWRDLFDDSYLFIIANNPEKVKKLYTDGNIFSREDDYRELILEALRKEEDR